MSSAGEVLVVNGWTVFAHPLFVAQLQALTDQLPVILAKHPQAYTRKNATKHMAAIRQLAFEVIPQDPTRPGYRLGNTLGDAHRHWFRVKFFQQYRLFFRFHAASSIIVLAWVNDEDTRRAYDSPDDAYRVFHKILDSGPPPGDGDELLAQAQRIT